MPSPKPDPALKLGESPERLDELEPLWNALQAHHSEITPNLGGA